MNIKKTKVAVLILDNADFRIKDITALCNKKISPGKYNNPKCIYMYLATEHKNTQGENK